MTTFAKIRPNSVVLVSGGARGVTAQCVIELARQYRCRFLLLGRSAIAEEPAWAEGCGDEATLKRQIMQVFLAQGHKPKPAMVQQRYRAIMTRREIMATLHAVQEAGGQAEYVSVDITDCEALQRAVTAASDRLGAVTGLIHGAGVLADKRIEHKADQDFERVYATKVTGLENLLSCVKPDQLDFLVMFSSFVGLYGNAGQADYALANEILNKSAHRLQQQYPDCRVVAIGWGPWDGGMVTAELKQHFAHLDMALIPPSFGAQLLAAELGPNPSPATQLTVMSRPIDLPTASPYGTGHSHRVRRQMTLAANPFVRDHVIGHQPVLPAMCGLSWIANVCEQRYPSYQFAEAKEFKVLKGIIFNADIAPAHMLDLKEIQSTDTAVTLEALVWSESERRIPRYHYRTHIVLARTAIPTNPTNPTNIAATHAGQVATPPSSLYQDGTLFHLSSFQSLRTILQLDANGLVSQCYLPALRPSQQGQFAVQSFNPYTADIFYQCLIVWIRQYRDLGSLPAGFKCLRQLQPLMFDQTFEVALTITGEDASTVTANATARLANGTTCLEIEAMQMVKSDHLKTLFLENAYAENAVALVS